MTTPVYLVKGSDDVLRGEALTKLLDEVVGDGDRSLMVDEFDLDYVKLGAAIDAAQTPPFLTDTRVVVVRRFGRFSKTEQVAGLIEYLADPLPTSTVVLVWEKSVSSNEAGEAASTSPRTPPALTKAVKAASGDVLDTDAPSGRSRAPWVADQLRTAGLDVDPKAQDLIVAMLGEDAGALVGLIERLRPSFPPGTRLRNEDIEPFLGPAGGVPPWDLTDAIDSGNVSDALDKLQRMMVGGDRHPLAIMATLQSHFTRMMRLDGAGARNDKEAAVVLGLKGSTFPAKKSLNQLQRLGRVKVRRAVALLAEADRDLRGQRAWPGNLVMEVLVARLTTLSRR